MTITLQALEYNAVFQLLNAITGKPAIVAQKLVAQIRNGADEGKAEKLDIEVENYELESILQGMKVLAEDSKSTVNDLGFLGFCASSLKIGKALDKVLAELISKDAKVEIDSAVELDA
jgi:hypothetical protein